MIDHRAEWMNESRFSVPSDDGRRRRARKKSGSSTRPHDFTVLNTVSAIASPATLRSSVPEVATPVGLAWASTPGLDTRHAARGGARQRLAEGEFAWNTRTVILGRRRS